MCRVMLFSVFPDAKKLSEINPKQKSSGIHSIHIIFGTVRIFVTVHIYWCGTHLLSII